MPFSVVMNIANIIVTQTYNKLNNVLKWCPYFMMSLGHGNKRCRVAMWLGGLQHQQLQRQLLLVFG